MFGVVAGRHKNCYNFKYVPYFLCRARGLGEDFYRGIDLDRGDAGVGEWGAKGGVGMGCADGWRGCGVSIEVWDGECELRSGIGCAGGDGWNRGEFGGWHDLLLCGDGV